MKLIKFYRIAILGIFSLFLFSSCSNEFDTETYENSSLISVKLQAAQSTFSEVNIDIQDVQFRVLEDENDPNAWLSLNTINEGVHDLTEATSNQMVVLVDFDEVPSKFIYSIRLVLGDQNSAEKNGVTYDLDMSPNCENESVNVVEKQLIANKLYDFVIELDIDSSIQLTNEGQAELDPKMNTLLRLFNLF